ncbi:MAG: hypothetical protein GX251_07550 [Firmicutes bacterium]|nr:hypothetical protein [Bacillota bacterium]
MLRLSSVREKITWKTLLVIGFYIAALVVFLAVYRPTQGRIERLEFELEQVAKREESLTRLVEERSGLQAKLQESEATLELYSRQIPSQYDLAEVLEAMETLGKSYDVQVAVLDHTPVRTIPDSDAGVISLALSLDGGEQLFSYLIHLQEVLPSLQLTRLTLGYFGKGRFMADVGAALRVFVLEHAPTTSLTLPDVSQVEPAGLRAEAFGRPFALIAQFFADDVRVLGIVQTEGDTRALVTSAGVRSWIRVGDRLSEALVTDISANSVSLVVDGIELKLAIGG